MKFDRKAGLAGRAANESGYTFEPKWPGRTDGIGATVTVRGPDSELVRAALRRQITAMQTREAAAKKRGLDVPPMTLEEIELQAIDLAVSYTITWDGFEDNGVAMPPTEANLRTIYSENPWLRRQVIDEAQDLGNFVRPPSSSSLSTPLPSGSLT